MMKSILLPLIIFLVLDGLWFNFLSGDSYSVAIQATTGRELNPIKFYSAGIVYLLMIIGFNYFVRPRVNTIEDGFKWGGLFGLILYGVFNFTNHAIFGGWNLQVSIKDSLWGMVACSLVMGLTMLIEQRI